MNDLKPRYNNGVIQNIRESELFDNDEFLTEEDAPNGDDTQKTQKAENPMDEQQLRIESLKIATKISKLFDNVQPSDLLEISDKVYNFIQHQNNSGEYGDSYGLDIQENNEEETPEENNDEENFEIPEEEENGNEGSGENDEENKEGESNEESESTDEDSDINPEDIFDFNI